jgi:uncharacterized protein (DUF2147 family)
MLISIIFAAATVAATPAPATLQGRWHTHEDKAIVEIAACGNRLCGTIVSAAPLPGTTAPPRDSHNPNPALQGRSIIGVRLLSGFIQQGANWTGGSIYNPVNGKTYRSQMALAPDGRLRVSGCVAFICQTQIWRRAN